MREIVLSYSWLALRIKPFYGFLGDFKLSMLNLQGLMSLAVQKASQR